MEVSGGDDGPSALGEMRLTQLNIDSVFTPLKMLHHHSAPQEAQSVVPLETSTQQDDNNTPSFPGKKESQMCL